MQEESPVVHPAEVPAKKVKEKPAKADAKKPKLRAGGKPVEEVLKIAEIDLSVCKSVRSSINLEAVERYKEVADLPPIDVFRGKAVDYAGDGGHRIARGVALEETTIRAMVHPCGSDAEAMRGALLHAIGPANVRHGLPRSSADLRATVETAILTPDIGVQSDRNIAEMCHCNRSVVKRVRIILRDKGRLTGKALALAKYADDPPVKTPEGTPATTLPVPFEQQTGRGEREVDAGKADAGESEVGDDWEYPDEGHGPESTGRAAIESTPEVQKDEKGRPVPFSLASVFMSRSSFRSIQARITGLMGEIKTLAANPAGDAIQLNPLEQDAHNLTSGLSGSMPYCVCPSCDGSGFQGPKSPCPTCSAVDGSTRGWVSRLRWQQMTASLQSVTEGPWEESE